MSWARPPLHAENCNRRGRRQRELRRQIQECCVSSVILIRLQWTVRGSNPRPRRCERRALPTELTARAVEHDYTGEVNLQSWMEWLRGILDVRAIIQWGGIAGITSIVFVETGLFFGFFLPGDSLLVTAGILAAAGVLDIRLLIICAAAAAVIGDQTGFLIGRR